MLKIENVVFQPPKRNASEYKDVFAIPCSCKHATVMARWHQVNHPAGAILFSHGNGEDLGGAQAEFAEKLALSTGMCVLSYDYCGYGFAGGEPSEKCCLDNIYACYQWLVEQRYVTPDRIYIMGHSLGCVPSIWMAATQPSAGLIVCSPFFSLRALALHYYGPTATFLAGLLANLSGFCNDKRAKHVLCKVFIYHGSEDTVIPIEQAEKLSGLFGGPVTKCWVKAGHNDVFSHMNWLIFTQKFAAWRLNKTL